MVLVFTLLFLVIGLLIFNSKLVKNNNFIFLFFTLFILGLVFIIDIESYRIIITIVASFLLLFLIYKNKIVTLKFVYFLTIFVFVLSFFNHKYYEYSEADNYINSEIINKVIPQELQNAYLDYLAIIGYNVEDIKKYLNSQKENLQVELNHMSLFEKYEFYNYSKEYIQTRSDYYASNKVAITQEIENEIIYYESLSEGTKIEYQLHLESKVKELVE